MTAKNLINAAKAEIGVKESPANSNKVKYTTAYGTITAWCVIFIWWLFKQLGRSDLFFGGQKCASCSQLMNWAKTKKQWVTSGYKPGDLLIYDWNGDGKPEHIGICTAVSDSTLLAIEGNTAVGNDSNGGQVMTRTRNIKNVLGAVRPLYDTETVNVTVSLPVIGKGEGEKWQVERIQLILNQMGWTGADGKALTVDGDFGKNTEAAVRSFQQAHGLEQDGIVGAKTWRGLLVWKR